jgi:hypothetical protein
MYISRFSLFLLITGALFVTSCARGALVQSHYTPQAIEVNGDKTGWPTTGTLEQGNSEFDIFFVNDDDFLYVYLSVKSPALLTDIERYGLKLYFDNDHKFRRSFGVVYPIGLLEGLSKIPGARKEYLENPGWVNFPENARLVKSIEDDMPNQIMIVQRLSKSDPNRALPIPIEALKAQGLEVSMYPESRLLDLEMKIPLQSSRSQQFAIDVKQGNVVYFGIEVSPPTVEEIMDDDNRYNADRQGLQDRNNPYGRSTQNPQVQAQVRNQLRGDFSRWFRIELSEI